MATSPIMVKWAVAAALLAVLFLTGDGAQAKTLAYLVLQESGQVLTLDTDTDTIIARRTLPGLKDFNGSAEFVVPSLADNLLLVVDEGGLRQDAHVVAYEFQSLARKREVVTLDEAPDILVPPRAPFFYLIWTVTQTTENEEGETEEEFVDMLMKVSKATLRPLGPASQVPFLGETPDRRTFAYSADGTRLFVYSPDTKQPIDTVDAQTLQLVTKLDLTPRLAPGLWGASIHDLQADRVLVNENTQSTATGDGHYTLFTVSLTDGSQSPRIPTGREGAGHLTPQGDKLVFFTGGDAAGRRRLLIFDVASGRKLGQVDFSVYDDHKFVGIRPAGDRAYLFSSAGPTSAAECTLTSISLTTFAVLKDIRLPKASIARMIFFEQP